MCTNMKRFYNRWTHSWQYAECGHCPACEQAKAFKRTQRIKNASYNGYTPLFVTLTYRNTFIPYIRKEDLKTNFSTVPIYRDASTRKVRISSDYKIRYKFKREYELISTLDRFKYRLFSSREDIDKLPKLKGCSDKDKVGILYFKDLQDYEKRVRINLERRYGIKKPIYTIKVSEYGPTTFRPHFHLIVYVPTENLAQCQLALDEAWPYDNKNTLERRIEIAKNAASYVSSYVNRNCDFPSFLSTNPFKPKHSFSRFLGFQVREFNAESLFESIRNGNIGYNKVSVDPIGVNRLTFVPFPRYFTDYYFKPFKGYSRLTHSQIRSIIVAPRQLKLDENLRKLICFFEKPKRLRSEEIGWFGNNPQYYDDYSVDYKSIDTVINHIELRVNRFLHDFVYYEDGKRYVGLPDNAYNRYLYADYLYSFTRTIASNRYKRQFDGIIDLKNMLELYYNLDDVKSHLVHNVDIALMLNSFDTKGVEYTTNPNLFNKVIQQTYQYENYYHKLLKRRKVTNHAMSESGCNV